MQGYCRLKLHSGGYLALHGGGYLLLHSKCNRSGDVPDWREVRIKKEDDMLMAIIKKFLEEVA